VVPRQHANTYERSATHWRRGPAGPPRSTRPGGALRHASSAATRQKPFGLFTLDGYEERRLLNGEESEPRPC